jgi:hypothetical protein
MIIGRLLMRFLLVPLGGAIAICVAMMFVMAAHWNRVTVSVEDDPSGFAAILLSAPVLAVATAYMLMPAALGAMVAEAFAIRSWMFHTVVGGLSAAVSLAKVGGFEKTYDLSDQPLIVVGSGIAAGFAYWLVAGWSAGFWRPVFAASAPPAEPSPAELPPPPPPPAAAA